MSIIRCSIVLSALALAPAALGGPEWDMDLSNDAGATVGDAQDVAGALTDPLQYIQGKLDGQLGPGGGDYQDIFRIYIPVPSLFRATVIGPPTFNGFTDFDTQMWLFDEGGLGILGNDDMAIGDMFSGFPLGGLPTDGGTGLVTPGFYLIAISGAGSVPFSGGGEIFDFTAPAEVSSADGLGAGLPLDFWGAAMGATGRYTIEFEGAFFTPAPGALGLLALGFVAPRRRRA